MLMLGNVAPKQIWLGSKKVKEAWLGSKKVWQDEVAPASLYRYVKLTYIKRYGDDQTSNVGFRCSRLELVDANENYFPWPESTVVQLPARSGTTSGHGASMMLDHQTTTFMYNRYINLPGEYIIDVGSEIIDPSVYIKWQWWTSNGAVSYPDTLMADFALALSKDGQTWIEVDRKTGWDGPIENQVLAYEGLLHM